MPEHVPATTVFGRRFRRRPSLVLCLWANITLRRGYCSTDRDVA